MQVDEAGEGGYGLACEEDLKRVEGGAGVACCEEAREDGHEGGEEHGGTHADHRCRRDHRRQARG